MPPCSRRSATKPKQRSKGGWPGLKPQDLQDISQKIKEKFKWTHEPRPFQEMAVVAQLTRKDVLIHAGTGMGKTVVAAGPHAHESTKGMVTFMVSPLLALQEEQVSVKVCIGGPRRLTEILKVTTFQTEFGLSATAVNSSHGGCKKEVLEVLGFLFKIKIDALTFIKRKFAQASGRL